MLTVIDRNRVRRTPRLLSDLQRQRKIAVVAVRRVPRRQLLAVRVRHRAQRRQRPAAVGHRGPRQGLETTRQTLHRRALEQRGRKAPLQLQRIAARLHRQFQVEADVMGVRCQRLYPQAVQDQGFLFVVLERQEHLDQRVMTQVALDLQRFHQQLERHVLVPEHRCGLRLVRFQQLRKILFPHQLMAEHQGIGEEPDQCRGAGLIATRRRHADHHIAVAGVLAQQH